MSASFELPKGYKFAGLKAGVKVRRSDLGVLLSARPASAAAMLTTNRSRAACTERIADLLPRDDLRAVVVLSGNANALTGEQGRRDEDRFAELTAGALGLEARTVATACTGVTGTALPVGLIAKAVGGIAESLGDDPTPFADAICTTDTRRKIAHRSLVVSGRKVHVLGIAKGSGMIHPGMATMLSFIITDLKATPAQLQESLHRTVPRTFNRITVDRDMSTNDMVLLLANGATPVGPAHGAPPPDAFVTAVEEVSRELAIAIARDGEGATRLLESEVRGAPDEETAADLARSMAESNLFKAALFSGDPNWSRAIAALGARAVDYPELPDPRTATVWLQGVKVYEAGLVPFDEVRLRRLMQQAELRIEVELPGGGPGAAKAWGCDLSYEYVRLNADIAATITEKRKGGLMRVNEMRRLSPKMRQEMLVDCLRHIERFKGMTAVIRVSGEAADKADLREALIQDVLLLRSAGLRPVLVHGGTPRVQHDLERVGEQLEMTDGAPDVQGEATRVVEATLTGRINRDLVALAHRLGGKAVGISGKDGDLIRAERSAGHAHGSAAGIVTRVDPTLLRALGRLNPHWSGDLRFRGRSLRRWEGAAFHRRVAFLHQVPVMFEGTVAENVKTACRWLGAEPPADPGAWLASARLDPGLWSKPAAGLSVGEKQRLALLRALLGRPEALLLDEVTASLDPASARAVEERVAAFHREGGAVLWIRHRERAPGEDARTWILAGGVLREDS